MAATQETDTVFLVKEAEEHCFLSPKDDHLELLNALFRNVEKVESGISREESVEILEGIIPERIRSI